MDAVQSFTPNGPTITVFKGCQSSSVKLKGMVGRHTTQVNELASWVPPNDISERKEQREFGKLRKQELKYGGR